VHIANEGNSVVDHLIPAWVGPSGFSLPLTVHQVLVAPDVVDIVETTNLGEIAAPSFIVALSEVDGLLPVGPPFNHCARLEEVRTQLIDVRSLSGITLWPEGKGQDILVVARAKELRAVLDEPRQRLITIYRLLGLIHTLEATRKLPQVHTLILVSHANSPGSTQLGFDILVLLHLIDILFIIFLDILLRIQDEHYEFVVHR